MMSGDETRALEWIERRALESLLEAAPAELRRELGLEWQETDGVLVSLARNEPSILLNRALGLGVERPARRETVARVVAAYREAGVGRFFFHLHPAAQPQDEIRDWLAAEGLEKYRGWMKFTRGPTPTPAVRSDLTLREIGPEHAADFGRIAGSGFGLSGRALALPALLASAPGWHAFMTFDGARPAGTGALFVEDGIGWTDWGATDPDFRRRGSQTALLAARIDKAIALGCRMIATETGEAVPGDPQHSYHNIMKAGFTEYGVRENWVPS